MAFRTQELESIQVQGVTAEYVDFSTFDAERGRMIGPMEIERNRAVVPRAQHAATVLAEGDRLELVTFVGGG